MYYYVNDNAQKNGDHEVHTSLCSFLPNLENRKFLGDFANCYDAIYAARIYYTQVNGCFYCANPCNTG